MLTQDQTRPLYADPVADQVEADLRDTGMIPAKLPEWKRKISESIIDLPSGQLQIERGGCGWKISQRLRGNDGCWGAIYLPGADSVEQIERDGPALVATALEMLARDIRQYIAAIAIAEKTQ